MGWWQIRNDGSGQIDWEVKREDSTLINAIPGKHDPKQMMYNGDGPADIMGTALDEITEEFNKAWGRNPCYEELLACFNFCANPMYED